MKFVALALALSISCAHAGDAPAPSHPEVERAALAAAASWLQSLDAEKFAECWDLSADLFKQAIPRERWRVTMLRSRLVLGKPKARELQSKRYATSLPGAPEAEYVVIEYRTAFENKDGVTEMITPMLDTNGVWRISAYAVR